MVVPVEPGEAPQPAVLDPRDFGCRPDGRVLEGIGIDAGSTTLRAPGGGLRPTDAGKSIAIPGASDLRATMRLVDRREVKGASIGPADLTVLTGTLIDPTKRPEQQEEQFLPRVHVGRSITVEGAGPGGAVLVTEIAQVLNATTIRLAVAASGPVSGTAVIVNRPDVVALSNYARRSVSGLTVDLGNRTILNASMTIGGGGLRSPDARFSSVDVAPNKTVIIVAAGLFVTTIASVQSPTRATLAAPAQHARTEAEGVQADVWNPDPDPETGGDSRFGFERLVAALPTFDVESAEIRFGPGVYDFSRAGSGGRANAAIGLVGLQNLTIRGAGAGATVLRLMPNQDLGRRDTHVVEMFDCRSLTLGDLSVHGAYLTMGNATEQMHGIQLNEGSEDIALERVRVFQSAGDGIRMLGRAANPQQGTPANKVRRVWVDGCRFVQNKRSGVGFQRAVELVWVRGCYIEMTPPSTDSCIDFEPTGNDPPTDIIIDSNVLVHGTGAIAVSLSGISGPEPAHRITFSSNVLLGGEIFSTDVAELTIERNIMVLRESDNAGRFLLNLQRGGDTVRIAGNLLIGDNQRVTGAINLSEVNNRQVSRALVTGNLCVLRRGQGVVVTGSDDVTVDGNMLVATGPCTQGVQVHSETSAMDHVCIRGNSITVGAGGSWQTGILFQAREPMRHVAAEGNSIAQATQAVVFTGVPSGFAETPVCALNRVEGVVTTPIAGFDALPEHAIVVGGGASRGGSAPQSGGGRFLAGVGNPNAAGQPPAGGVRGNVGDIFQRLDANPDGTLWVKESGNGTTTGWIPK